MSAQELRTDILTGRQMILAAGRNDRPQVTTAPPATSFDEFDPFLEGHEQETPDESLALRRANSKPNQPGWLLRVVPNRYPAVSAASEITGTFANGVHEVVIECPDQRSRLTQLTTIEVARILAAWQQRIRNLSTTPGIRSVSVFRNEGSGAGASLPHSHSQIVAADFISQQLQQRVDRAVEFDAAKPERLFQNWLRSELGSGDRVVHTNHSVAIVCPFASRVDGHVRFVPVEDTPTNFAELNEVKLSDLASLLHTVVVAFETANGSTDHNLNLVLPPTEQPDLFPWILEFLPRRNRFAGFEMMTDTDIVTTTPEATAKLLSRGNFDTVTQQPICPDDFRWSRSLQSFGRD